MAEDRCDACEALQIEFDEYKMIGEEIEGELERQVETMRATLDEADKELERTTDRFKTASEELKKCEKLLAEEQDKVTSLTVEKDSHKRKKINLENKCDSMEERLRSLEMEMEGKNSELDRLKEDLIIERMDRVSDVEAYQEQLMAVEQRLIEKEEIEAELLKKIELLTKAVSSAQVTHQSDKELVYSESQTQPIDIKVNSYENTMNNECKPITADKQIQVENSQNGGRRTSMANMSFNIIGAERDIMAMSQSLLNDNDARQQAIYIGRKRDSVLQDDDFLMAELSKIANRERYNSRSSHETGRHSISIKPASQNDSRTVLEEMDSDDEMHHIPLPGAYMEYIEEIGHYLKDDIGNDDDIAKVNALKRWQTINLDKIIAKIKFNLKQKRLQRACIMMKTTHKNDTETQNDHTNSEMELDSSFKNKVNQAKVEQIGAKEESDLGFIKNPIKSVCLNKLIEPSELAENSSQQSSKRDLKFITSSGVYYESSKISSKTTSLAPKANKIKTSTIEMKNTDSKEVKAATQPQKSNAAKLYK